MAEPLLQKPDSAMEEASQAFGFLKIMKESLKLVPKNGKIMVTITLLSLLPSLLFLLLVYFHKFIAKKVDKAIKESPWSDQITIAFDLAFLLVAGIGFVAATAVISGTRAMVVILASAVSYTDEKPPLPQRLATMRGRCSGQPKPRTPRRWRSQTCGALVFAALTFYVTAFGLDAAALAVTLAAGSAVLGFSIYAGVVWNLAAVVTVLEEGEAAARARKLAVGHRRQGLMVNFLVCLVILSGIGGYSLVLEDRCYWNIDTIAINGALFLGVCFVANTFVGIAYTVLYFECKKVHDQEIDTQVKV